MENKQKVTVELKNGRFRLLNSAKADDLNPKAMVLCATAQCAGLTVMGLLHKHKVTPKKLEITIEGTLNTEKLQASSRFHNFTIAYNVECKSLNDQQYISQAIYDAQEHECGLIAMLKCSAPVSYDIAIVSTEIVNV